RAHHRVPRVQRHRGRRGREPLRGRRRRAVDLCAGSRRKRGRTERTARMRIRTAWLAALIAPAVLAAPPVEEVPFIVTPDNVTLAMLNLAKVGSEDYVIDLGSGDGRIVITAAKRFGARGLGVEIVP